jgi:hypothetical protein
MRPQPACAFEGPSDEESRSRHPQLQVPNYRLHRTSSAGAQLGEIRNFEVISHLDGRFFCHAAGVVSRYMKTARPGRCGSALQYARQGKAINRQVAQDASVTTSVMMTSYVTERDELRQKSNRFFARIVAALHPTVAARYGHAETPVDALKRPFRLAVDTGDWKTAAEIAVQLDDTHSSAA